MRYVAYIGNLTRLAVELVNGDEPSELRREFFQQHDVVEPDDPGDLLPALRDAVAAVADGGPPLPVNLLLDRFPPAMRAVPVETISHPHVELLGAARLLSNP